MSMLGISLLNQIVNQELYENVELLSAAEILNKLRKAIIQSLGHGAEESLQDGMDMSLVIINKKTNKLNYSGAYTPLILIKNDKLITLKADRMPVGYHYIKISDDFKNQYVEIAKNDFIYLFSDGYQDQFGEDGTQKFSPQAFRSLIFENRNLPMKNQRQILEENLDKWKGSCRQLDDIIVIGIKI